MAGTADPSFDWWSHCHYVGCCLQLPEYGNRVPIEGLSKLKNPEKKIMGEPRPKPRRALPPEMNANLTLDNISTRWHDMENSTIEFDEKDCSAQVGK